MTIATTKKLFIFLMLFAFLVVGLLGVLPLPMNIHGGDHIGGMTPGCPLMNVTTLCAMNPFEHIAAWQEAMTTLSPKGIFALLTLILSFAILALVLQRLQFLTEKLFIFSRIRHRIAQIFSLRSPLEEAFSNGILNSKLYVIFAHR